ncbi:MAG: hypothetical protein ACRC7C_00495, partial [Beijerinckiaceae bacterium]
MDQRIKDGQPDRQLHQSRSVIKTAQAGTGRNGFAKSEICDMADAPRKSLQRFRDQLDASQPKIIRNRALIQDKRWREIEDKTDRARNYHERRARTGKIGGKEALQGDTNDLQGVNFLAEGARRRRAVGYIEAPAAGQTNVGTGFMISPRLFITNQHVITNEAIA